MTNVVCPRETDPGAKVQSRYYASSLGGSAEQLIIEARAHWGIENSLQWNMDVTYREGAEPVPQRATAPRTRPHCGKYHTTC